ncbi:MAG: tetratricopeptide repeat protein [Polyangiaceae bacterium]
MRNAILSLTLSLCVLQASAALGAPTEAENQQAAQVLFDAGTELVKKGDYAAACPKFEEATKLYPNGVGLRESLADCYVHIKKYASAEATYDRAVSLSITASNQQRAEKNRAKKDELTPHLSKFTVSVPPETASIKGLVVTRDGEEVRPALFNLELKVDGGTFVVHAEAPGYQPFHQEVTVAELDADAKVVVVLEKKLGDARSEGGEPNKVETATSATSESAPPENLSNPYTATPEQAESGGMSPIRIGGFVVGGLGVVLGAVGIGVAVTGIQGTEDAVDAYNAARDKGDSAGLDKAVADHADATVLIEAGWSVAAVGGAALIAGIIMIAAAPSTDKPASVGVSVAPWIMDEAGEPRPRGLLVAGHW